MADQHDSPAEVAPGVFRFGSDLVNWYAVVDGDGVLLIDAGFPRHWSQLRPGLAALGRSVSDIEALIITHSHVDHTGFAQRLRARYGTPVLVHPADAPHGARRFPPMRLYLRPQSWALLGEGLRDGMFRTPRIDGVTELDSTVTLDLPGAPRAVHVGGHTPGSTVVVLDDRSAVFTGDSLVTEDPYTRRTGPRVMLCAVHHDAPRAHAALDVMEGLDTAYVLPGHGPVWSDGIAAACAQARAVGPSHAGPSLPNPGGRSSSVSG